MYRILIADDEPIERTVVAKTLQRYFEDQLEIVAAENGREAVQLFFEKDCQIALLDIEMVRCEEIFLPYIETKDGQTVYEKLEEKRFLLDG